MSSDPIRREVVVDATCAHAFDIFTRHIGDWWPLGDFGVHGTGSTVSFEGDGRLVERSPDGAATCWGEVTVWEDPARVGFTWHPGDPAVVTTVTVTFEAVADRTELAPARTLVVLEHAGWDRLADPAAQRDGYGRGWPTVLGCYAGRLAAPVVSDTDAHDDTDTEDHTWVALLHRPGPGADADRPVTGQPAFGEHIAFLQRMHHAGYLVAAGPLSDRNGEGMTVLRLPGADRLEEATRLATEDDASVAGGFFTVTIRPWQVNLS